MIDNGYLLLHVETRKKCAFPIALRVFSCQNCVAGRHFRVDSGALGRPPATGRAGVSRAQVSAGPFSAT